MIEINKIEYSKNPTKTGETFLISVSVTETYATWNDLKSKALNVIKSLSWGKVKRKIF